MNQVINKHHVVNIDFYDKSPTSYIYDIEKDGFYSIWDSGERIYINYQKDNQYLREGNELYNKPYIVFTLVNKNFYIKTFDKIESLKKWLDLEFPKDKGFLSI